MMSTPSRLRECWQQQTALFTPEGGQDHIAVKVTDSLDTGPTASFQLTAADGRTWWVSTQVAAGAIVRHEHTLLSAIPEVPVLNTDGSGETSENVTRCTSPRNSPTHGPYHGGNLENGDDDQSTGFYSPSSDVDFPGRPKDQHGTAGPSEDSANGMKTSTSSSVSLPYSPCSSDAPQVSKDIHLRYPQNSGPGPIRSSSGTMVIIIIISLSFSYKYQYLHHYHHHYQ